MGRRTGDTRIEIMLSESEIEGVRAAAASQEPPLSVANYVRKRLGLELREAGGIRPGGFEPGNQYAAKKPTRKRRS